METNLCHLLITRPQNFTQFASQLALAFSSKIVYLRFFNTLFSPIGVAADLGSDLQYQDLSHDSSSDEEVS